MAKFLKLPSTTVSKRVDPLSKRGKKLQKNPGHQTLWGLTELFWPTFLAFSGQTLAKWIKLIGILNGLYFKNGTFTTHHKDGRQFGLPLLKYTLRVLKRCPLFSPTLPEVSRGSLGEWIKTQMRFVGLIQPALRIRMTSRGQHQRAPRQVGRDKLAYLWQHRKSKAIEIILNNSTYPGPLPAVNDVEVVQNSKAKN